ncbi:MAG: type II toxin-antitoxin system RelE/ParE family toxin [Myxococcales bacterium]|nr:type II toxin-antitoxin system RelE/ParE family toxin [Myxococcales bacterium]
MRSIIFRPDAAADVDEAYRWYEAQRAGLGEELLARVQAALNAIGEALLACPILHRDTRRALIDRFPYGIFFRVYDANIVVVAVLHAGRHPRTWRRR